MQTSRQTRRLGTLPVPFWRMSMISDTCRRRRRTRIQSRQRLGTLSVPTSPDICDLTYEAPARISRQPQNGGAKRRA